MPIPSEINALARRINNEIEQIEQETTESINQALAILERLTENNVLIQMYAFLNSVIFLLSTERKRIQTILESLSVSDEITKEEIQMAGEDLSTKLGRLLETKLRVSNIKNRLENLQ